MSAKTSIEWTATVHADGTVTPGKTWNPVTGCTKVSAGCKNCYAEGIAKRLWPTTYPLVPVPESEQEVIPSPHGVGGFRVLTRPRRFTDVQCHEDRLLAPLSWRKPSRVFVNSMSDLFHEDVPDEFIDQVFNVMAYSPHHTFQVLTKRPERMLRYLSVGDRPEAVFDALYHSQIAERLGKKADDAICRGMDRVTVASVEHFEWPLPNVWLGVSVENRQWRSRIDDLRQTPAAVRFVSFEPLLEDVSDGLDLTGIQWGIWGGESGGAARPLDVAWIRRGVVVCRRFGTCPFVKQLGAHVVDRNDAGFEGDRSTSWPMGTRYDELDHAAYQGALVRVWLTDRKGGDAAEWSEDLRVREYPR